jgi:hypothetical protein
MDQSSDGLRHLTAAVAQELRRELKDMLVNELRTQQQSQGRGTLPLPFDFSFILALSDHNRC